MLIQLNKHKKGRKPGIVLFLLFFASCSTTHFYTDPKVKVSRQVHRGYLSDLLPESSGLAFKGDSLMSFNDSGGGAELFAFDPDSPASVRIYPVPGTSNIDWEAITTDSSYYYIADVGNNFGARDTVVIYRWTRNAWMYSMVLPDMIRIHFLDAPQEKSSKAWSQNDCEAVALIHDSLWLFTKNHLREITQVYKIPAQPGFYAVEASMILYPEMLVTDAHFNPDTQILFLLGYHHFIPVLSAYSFQQNIPIPWFRTKFWSMLGIQTEGIVSQGYTIFISNERSRKKQSLFSLQYRIPPR